MLEAIIEWIMSFFSKPTVSVDTEDDTTNEIIEQNEPEPNIEMSDYSNIMVHIDNGHASSTKGKRSPYTANKVPPKLDFYEYKFTREVAYILKDKLESKGFNVNIVCPELNEDIKLTVRANRANDVKRKNPNMKHLFISIHSNAFGKGESWNSARGWSAWTTKGQNNSDKFADCLYNAAEKILPKYNMTIRTEKSPDGDRDYEENFTVIYVANMPAVLTENLFYTNIKDTEFLLSDTGKEAIAEIHLQGIIEYSDNYLK